MRQPTLRPSEIVQLLSSSTDNPNAILQEYGNIAHHILKRMKISLEEHVLWGEDPVLVFDVLTREWRRDNTSKNTKFLQWFSKMAFRAARFNSKFDSAVVSNWAEAVKYLLHAYTSLDVPCCREESTLPWKREEENKREFGVRANNLHFSCGISMKRMTRIRSLLMIYGLQSGQLLLDTKEVCHHWPWLSMTLFSTLLMTHTPTTLILSLW